VLRKVQPGFDDFVAEKYHDQVAAALARWTDQLLKSPAHNAEIESALASTLNATPPIPVESQKVRTSSFLDVFRSNFAPEKHFDRAAWIRDWRSTLSGFSSLQTAESQVIEIRLNNGSNSITGAAPSSLQTRVRYEFVGSGTGFHREHRIGNWDLTWEINATGELKITRWSIVDETRSQSLSPVFADIAQQTLGRNPSYAAQFLPGIDHWRTILDGASGIDIYGHNGVSFADIDGDGFDDLYICQPAGLPNRLYRNRGDGTFEDITESSGLGLLDNTACALFADFSNSGRQDAIIVRTTGPLLFLNDGHGKFQLKPDAFHFAGEPQGTFTGAAVADYDRDGWLDIYFCLYIYYQGTDQYRYPAPYYDANNGPPNFMFRNNRDGSFRDVTKETKLDQNNTRFSFCCGWNDYDGDGWPDLYVVNDFGRKNLYRNNGNGTFTDVAAEAGVEDVGAGMSVCWLDADNDGKQNLYVADMWTAAGVRVSEQAAFQKDANPETRAFYRKHAMGNSLFRNRDGKGFEDLTAKSGTGMGRWAWCSDSWDFDHDGHSDLYIANGMITGPSSARDDLNSFFWRQVVANSPAESRPNYNYDQGWSAINELIRADGTWSGFERNVFYANNGDGTFSDVSGAIDLDFIEDCRSFALCDFDHDGRLEVVLKTRNSPQLRVLKNVVKDLNPSIAFRLTGKKSNRDAIGARVVVDTGATQITRVLHAGSGFLAQHSKELFFGLGRTKPTVNATIEWPSGDKQIFRDLPINHRVSVVENEATPRMEAFQTIAPSSDRPSASLEPYSTPAAFSTWLLAPVEAPNFSSQDQNGKAQTLASLRGKPTLLYFWASTSVSQKSLADLNSAYSKWQARGLQLVAINAEESQSSDSSKTTAPVAPKNHFSFPTIAYDPDLIAIYNILYRSLYDRHRDMNVPTSFLIDEEGLMVKIYQGTIEPDRVLEDSRNTPRTAEARMERGLPFPGVATTTEFTRNYLSYGSIFFERGYMTEAEHFLQLALREDPDNSEALYGLGSVYLQENKTADARTTFERVIKLPQRYPGTLPNAWNNLGLLSAREGHTDEAIQQFQQALQLDPDHFIALENLGNAYRQAKRWDDAKATLQHALQLNPGSAEANYAIGMVYAQTDDENRAFDFLQKAIAEKPAYPEALNNLGVLYLRKNQPTDAESSFKEAIRVAPTFEQSYFNLARLYAIEGNNAAARQVLTDLLQRHPGDPQIERALSQLPQ
jgi:tetratricopeptide (TPR) repeat protein